MSGLYGALFSGVTGINAQTQAMTMISDNVVNVNTVGYKEVKARFNTLVTNSITAGLFTSGGVRSTPLQVMDKQGLIQGSSSTTDIAVNGNGFFVTSTVDDPSGSAGEIVFTRAGSFRPDKEGNLVNASGLYLMAWPYEQRADAEFSGTPGTFNRKGQNVEFADNGLPVDLTPSSAEVVNLSDLTGNASATTAVSLRINLDATQTVVPQSIAEYKADMSVAAGTEVAINSGLDVVFNATDGTIISSGLINAPILPGQTVTFTNTTSNNNTFTVLEFDPTTGTIRVDTGASPALTDETDSDGARVATNAQNFPGAAASVIDHTAAIQAAATNMTIDDTGNTITTDAFKNLPIQAGDVVTINSASFGANISAQVSSYNAVTGEIAFATSFAGADPMATGQPAITTAAISSFTIAKARPGLASYIESGSIAFTSAQVEAATSLSNPGSAGDLIPDFERSITVIDGQGSQHPLTFSFKKDDSADTFGQTGGAANTWYVEVTSAEADKDLSNAIAGGAESLHPHDMVAFGKITFNSDGSIDNSASLLYGYEQESQNYALLTSIDSSFDIKWDETTTGATPSDPASAQSTTTTGDDLQTITIDWGSQDQLNGLSQLEGDSVLFSHDSDGATFGTFSGVTIDEEGFVVANFNNGESARTHRISMATFPSDAGLQNLSGNAFQQTAASGNASFQLPNSGTAGKIAPSALEASTVDLGTEFTNMIVVQRAYSASTKVITTSDEMLDELLRVKR